MLRSFSIILFTFLLMPLFAQQQADLTYLPPILNPVYQEGKGPIVFIDEGHYNFHTKEGGYQAFAHLIERDGYQVLAFKGAFTKQKLEKGKILVISNALHASNVSKWHLPCPSAFTVEEIKVVEHWVAEGGRLFLIADHMPLAGAAIDLAAAFNFEFTNGFVMDTSQNGPAIFERQNGSLKDNEITNGRNAGERVERIVTFTGQGFQIPADAKPILEFDQRYINFFPDTAWVFSATTRRKSMDGWCQGAFRHYKKGRVVVFGEAAMFTAQLAGPQKQKMGMNHPIAPENYRLLLNIIHWLDGLIL